MLKIWLSLRLLLRPTSGILLARHHALRQRLFVLMVFDGGWAGPGLFLLALEQLEFGTLLLMTLLHLLEQINNYRLAHLRLAISLQLQG